MFKIMGKYMEMESEEVDAFDDGTEAQEMLAEYRMAYGAGWKLWIVISGDTHGNGKHEETH